MRSLTALSASVLFGSVYANSFAGTIKNGKKNFAYIGKYAFGFDG
jgi:hypothetical protein